MKKISLSGLVGEPVSHDPDITKHVFLRKGQVPRLTNFSRVMLSAGQSVSAHSHADMFEVFYVVGGRGVFWVNEAHHDLCAGDCILIEPGEKHHLAAAETGQLELLYFGVVAGTED